MYSINNRRIPDQKTYDKQSLWSKNIWYTIENENVVDEHEHILIERTSRYRLGTKRISTENENLFDEHGHPHEYSSFRGHSMQCTTDLDHFGPRRSTVRPIVVCGIQVTTWAQYCLTLGHYYQWHSNNAGSILSTIFRFRFGLEEADFSRIRSGSVQDLTGSKCSAVGSHPVTSCIVSIWQVQSPAPLNTMSVRQVASPFPKSLHGLGWIISPVVIHYGQDRIE